MADTRKPLGENTKLTITIPDSDDNQSVKAHERTYIIEETIGLGGSCIVYRANYAEKLDKPADRTVVIKEFYPNPGHNIEITREYSNDLKHNNDNKWTSLLDSFKKGSGNYIKYYEANEGGSVPRPFIFGEANGTFYAVSDPADGKVLSINSFNGDLTLYRIAKITKSLADAISKFHELDLLYLDCKPENIYHSVLDEDHDHVRLFDFDTVVSTDEIKNNSVTFNSYSIRWAAPEQLKGQPPTFQTDIYSVGAVFFYMITGKNPSNDNPNGIPGNEPDIVKIENDKYDWERNSGLFEGHAEKAKELVKKIAKNTLAESPEKRYKEISQLIDDLDNLAGMTINAQENKASTPLYKSIREQTNKFSDIESLLLLSLQNNEKNDDLKKMGYTQQKQCCPDKNPEASFSLYLTNAQNDEYPNSSYYKYMVGQYFEYGWGKTGKNIEKATEWYEKSDYPGAKYRLARCFLQDEYERKDPDRAFKLCEEAASADFSEAYNLLGYCYHNGLGTEKNPDESVKWFKKGADNDDCVAQFNLALSYLRGDGIEKDAEKAFNLFKKAARQNYAKACGYLGDLYFKGDGTIEDSDKAVKWYKKGAKLEHATSQYNYGKFMYFGTNGLEKNTEKGIKWIKKAAKQNDTVAMFTLGAIYHPTSDYEEKNTEISIKWFEKAAKQNSPEAMYELALMYLPYNDSCIEENMNTSIKWLEKAAKLDYPEALCELGDIYYFGEPDEPGIEPDFARSFQLHKRAAALEYSGAYGRMGLYYYYGDFVDQNYDEAVKWLEKADEETDDVVAQALLGEYYLKVCKDKDKTLGYLNKALKNGFDTSEQIKELEESWDSE